MARVRGLLLLCFVMPMIKGSLRYPCKLGLDCPDTTVQTLETFPLILDCKVADSTKVTPDEAQVTYNELEQSKMNMSKAISEIAGYDSDSRDKEIAKEAASLINAGTGCLAEAMFAKLKFGERKITAAKEYLKEKQKFELTMVKYDKMICQNKTAIEQRKKMILELREVNKSLQEMINATQESTTKLASAINNLNVIDWQDRNETLLFHRLNLAYYESVMADIFDPTIEDIKDYPDVRYMHKECIKRSPISILEEVKTFYQRVLNKFMSSTDFCYDDEYLQAVGRFHKFINKLELAYPVCSYASYILKSRSMSDLSIKVYTTNILKNFEFFQNKKEETMEFCRKKLYLPEVLKNLTITYGNYYKTEINEPFEKELEKIYAPRILLPEKCFFP